MGPAVASGVKEDIEAKGQGKEVQPVKASKKKLDADEVKT